MNNNGCQRNNDCACNNGIKKILNVIFLLQENAEEANEVLSTCDKPFLGPCPKGCQFNTRPIMLFTSAGTAWEIPVNEDDAEVNENGERGCRKTSNVFRLEKLDDCSATCRVLVRNNRTGGFSKTDSFFTINLCCVCCIKCLPDTYVEGIC